MRMREATMAACAEKKHSVSKPGYTASTGIPAQWF